MATLTIYIPFLGEAASDEPGPEDRLLPRLLARGHHEDLHQPDHHRRLWQLLDPADAAIDAPFAPVMRRGDGVTSTAKYWLCADPVSLHADLTTLRLIDGRAFDLTADEADALIASLNGELGGPGWRLQRGGSPRRWYLGLDTTLSATAPSPRLVAGGDFDASLPRGKDGTTLRRWLNDAQMVLHASPINTARERRGAPPINSVWFWGGGDDTAASVNPARARLAPRAFDLVLADDPLSIGLAERFGLSHLSLPDIAELPDLLRARSREAALLVLIPESTGATTPRVYLAERVAALRQALRRALVDRVRIESDSDRWTLGRWDLLRFWRRIRPLGVHG